MDRSWLLECLVGAHLVQPPVWLCKTRVLFRVNYCSHTDFLHYFHPFQNAASFEKSCGSKSPKIDSKKTPNSTDQVSSQCFATNGGVKAPHRPGQQVKGFFEKKSLFQNVILLIAGVRKYDTNGNVMHNFYKSKIENSYHWFHRIKFDPQKNGLSHWMIPEQWFFLRYPPNFI